MEIFTLLETLEDILERSKSVPFSGKAIVDKEEMLEMIKEIRLKLPDELKQAKWVKEERQRIIEEAQKEADGIVKEAENRIISMIDEHEITRKAYDQKAEIIETANEMSREISKGTKEYADNLLGETETLLTDTLTNLTNNIAEAVNLIQISLEDNIKTVQNGRKELK
jgi:cell division septum initiation protein DivIVA